MGLISGIFMGILFGIALMAGWRHMMRYRSNKRVAKAVDMKLLGSLSRDDLKKLCGDNFPEWISFPVYEQVKWLNKLLSKLWPFVADAAELVIKESVEPLLEEYRPTGITSLKFSKLFLGTVAPKIEGIRVQSLKKGQITMDIDLRWGGDPSIILAVEAALVASIPIQLKDLQVFTVIRVIFQLAEEIPCISAVVVALLAEDYWTRKRTTAWWFYSCCFLILLDLRVTIWPCINWGGSLFRNNSMVIGMAWEQADGVAKTSGYCARESCCKSGGSPLGRDCSCCTF